MRYEDIEEMRDVDMDDVRRMRRVLLPPTTTLCLLAKFSIRIAKPEQYLDMDDRKRKYVGLELNVKVLRMLSC
jgi:hypothetical protein